MSLALDAEELTSAGDEGGTLLWIQHIYIPLEDEWWEVLQSGGRRVIGYDGNRKDKKTLSVVGVYPLDSFGLFVDL